MLRGLGLSGRLIGFFWGFRGLGVIGFRRLEFREYLVGASPDTI